MKKFSLAPVHFRPKFFAGACKPLAPPWGGGGGRGWDPPPPWTPPPTKGRSQPSACARGMRPPSGFPSNLNLNQPPTTAPPPRHSERRYFCNALAMNGAERRRYYCNALPASHALVS